MPPEIFSLEPRSFSRACSQALTLGITLLCWRAPAAQQGQVVLNPLASPAGNLLQLPVSAAAKATLSGELSKRDYAGAEQLLIGAIERNPHSPQLLTFLGGVYFLAGSYLECAVAMKKAEVLASLPDPDRFTLAMAYILLGHSDWAQPELERLIKSEPRNALYYYWLSRIEYDRKLYAAAVVQARKAIQLDSRFTRAYDHIGLCYEGLGKYSDAMKAYRTAVGLNGQSRPPSPWPPLDFGALLVRLNKLNAGATYLEEALRYDPRFPQAHCQLGLLYEKRGQWEQAIQQLRAAGSLNPSYAEPHYLLGRAYEQMRRTREAQAEFSTFKKIKQDNQAQPLE